MFDKIKKNKPLGDNNMSNTSHDIILDYKIQFTVILSNDKISNLLKDIANQSISIESFNIQYDNVPNNNIFKFIVGSNNKLTKKEISDIRKILEKSYISYNEKSVVQVIIPNSNHGTLEDVYTTLYNYVNIYSVYVGEKDCLYIESDNPIKTYNILKTYYDIKSMIGDKY